MARGREVDIIAAAQAGRALARYFPLDNHVGALLTIASPKFNGPIAKAMEYTDLSWLVGPVLAFVIYWILAHRAVKEETVRLEAEYGPIPTPHD